MKPLRLACSNIAWNDEEEPSALACLRKHEISALEFAPTRAWPNWTGATPVTARAVSRKYRHKGFSIVSLQALLFGQPAAQLFGTDNGVAFEAHLTYVATLGAALGAGVAVLGAPRNRVRGALTSAAALERALPLFDRLAQRYHEAGMVLAVEPARPEYGGDFLCTTREVIELVQAVNHPGLAVHLDAAAMYAAGEQLPDVWAQTGGRHLAHYQLSEPGLAGFESPQAPQLENLRFLRRAGYTGWCSIEMARPSLGLAQSGPWEILRAAVADWAQLR